MPGFNFETFIGFVAVLVMAALTYFLTKYFDKFDAFTKAINSLNVTITRIEGKFDLYDEKSIAIKNDVVKIEQKLDKHGNEIKGLDARMSGIELKHKILHPKDDTGC